MKLLSASSFYRFPFDQKARSEDGHFINVQSRIFGVADGNSMAFSPQNPPLLYGGLTGGQMVIRETSLAVCGNAQPKSVGNLLLLANSKVLFMHQEQGKYPMQGDDVAGASFAFCQPSQDGITFLLGGDCFALVETKNDPVFLTGFDKTAFEIEKKYQNKFSEYLKQANGNKGHVWDLYWSTYKAKRIFCQNRNIGNGGYATINGDLALGSCWTEKTISWDLHPNFVLLGTDGLLPPTEVHPEKFDHLAQLLCQFYLQGGISFILAWRDRIEEENISLNYIEGWPEAAAIELKFG